MVTEERMQKLFAHANPIPDASSVDLDPIGAAAYLGILEERSSDMTQLDTATQRSDTKKRGMRAAVAAAAAVVVIGAVGIVIALTGGDDVSAQDLVGVWESADGVFVQFNDDGTFTAAWTLDEVSAGTFETGTWSYDGTEFVWVTAEGNCAPGDEGRYAVEFVEDDAVLLNPIWDPCLDRVADLNRGPMHRISS